jgi:hypothetical protein
VRGSGRKVAALAGAVTLAVVFAAPSPARAKADYGVAIAGKNVRVGDTVTVTVTYGNDGGVSADDKMCLFQIVGGTAPHPHSTGYANDYAVPAGDRFVKVAACQHPAPDGPDSIIGPDEYDRGITTYRLKTISDGWLAFAVFPDGPRLSDGPYALSDIEGVRGSGGRHPGAAAAKTEFLSIIPVQEPVTTPTSAPQATSGPADSAGVPGTPMVLPSADETDDPSSDEAADEQAARDHTPKLWWLAAAGTGGLLLGCLLTGAVMVLRSRARERGQR